MTHIYSVHPVDLLQKIELAGFKSYRFKQLMNWIYRRAETDLDAMSDLAAQFKTYLSDSYDFTLPEIQKTQHAQDNSIKFVLKLKDGELIECVIMPEGKKRTLCISSQVGCAYSCSFCATGKIGLVRDLSVEEIIAQFIVALQNSGGESITNLVFMGMGEPLDNLENVIKAIQILQSDHSIQFSPRRMTLSTCGVVPMIYELAATGIKIKLAVSLNSVLDEKRSALMPVNKMYNLNDLKKAILFYRKKSPWRVTLEYIMIPEFNMGDSDIKALKKFAGDISCKLNLISYNKVEGFPWRSPTRHEVEEFHKKLQELPIAVTIRKSKGSDIAAACGQLAAVSKR